MFTNRPVVSLSDDELHTCVTVERVVFVVKFLQLFDVFVLKLENLFSCWLRNFCDLYRSSNYHSEWLPVRDNPKIVLENSPAEKDDWSKAHNIL